MNNSFRNLKLIKRNIFMLEIWLVNENISFEVFELFSSCYLAISPSKMNAFVLFLRSMRTSLMEARNDSILFKYYELYSTNIKKIVAILPDMHVDYCSAISDEDIPSDCKLYLDSELFNVDNLNNINFDQEIEVSTSSSKKGEFLINLEEWNSFAKLLEILLYFPKIGLICSIPRWKMSLFVYYALNISM